MPVFVARDHEGRIESIVIAANRDFADAFWLGQGIHAHTVDQLPSEIPKDHPYKVIQVLKTELKKLSSLGGNPREYRTVPRR